MQSATAPFYGTPSENQAHRIQQIVLRRETELAQIDGDIIRVRALLQQLLRDRNDIRESLEAHKALIVPPPIPALQRVPPEIWVQIFMFSVNDAWTSGYPRIDIRKPPLLLGQVCSAWRTVSLSTPKLWSSICISKRTRVSAIPLIETWLQRSEAMPLSIEIHGLSSDFPNVVLDAFVPHSPRWQHLALFLSNSSLAKLFANAILPSLDTLMLRISGKPHQVPISRTANRLHSVALVISRGIRPNPDILDLPWAQLSHLTVTSISGSIDDGYDILTQCFALTHCSLFAAASTSSTRINSLISLPNLLILQLTTNRDPGPLLDSLILPRLFQLEIDFIDLKYEPSVWPKTEILSLVARSSCQLQSLVLRDKKIPEADLVECCRCMPSLLHLLVTGSGEKRVPVRTIELLRSRTDSDERNVWSSV